MHRLVEISLKHKFLVLTLTVLMVGVGIHSMLRLPIDAVPDVTPNQVQVLTQAPGLGPLEVEQFITFPVETAVSGLPGIEKVRSVSRFGLSAVYIYFAEDVDLYFARQLVTERLPAAREAIPAGYGTPEMGPLSTGLGEIYQFEVRGDGYSLMELRTILDWDIAFKLRSLPGVIEVNSFGGESRAYQVELDADRLTSLNLSLDQVFQAIERNNANVGGGYIERNQEQYVIRGEGLATSREDLANIVVATSPDGTPIYVRNIADVKFAPLVRQGAVTRDGRGEIVSGVVMMLIGENARVVTERVRERLDQIEKSLPPGVEIDTYYDRDTLVQRTIRTVRNNLIEGGLLVIAVLFLVLGNFRGGLLVAAAIPLSMLFAFTGMVLSGTSGNLMSLGAIDFGIIVDGSVVMVENILRRLGQTRGRGAPRTAVILDAAREVARPVFFSVGIITLVYLPILTLQGLEGKLYRPMALTVVLALVGSLVLALTFVPAAASLIFRGPVSSRQTFVMRWAKAAYMPLLRRAVASPTIVALIAVTVFAGSLCLVPFLGAEFVPRLEEGTIAISATRLPSVSLTESVNSSTMVEKSLAGFPEVESVVSRIGQPEIPTDPMGIEMSDIYVLLKPREEWETGETQEELVDAFSETLEDKVPGNAFSFTQPIELRVQELIAGVRSELAVTLYGDDLDRLRETADEIVRAVQRVPGAADVKAEQTAGLPFLRIRVRREDMARYGINASEVLQVVETIGGKRVGQVFEGQRRFPIQVRFRPEDRLDINRIRELKVADPTGRLIPMSQLADVWVEEGPAQITRENIHRRITVEANVRGRDLAGFVDEVQRTIDANVQLPTGYYVEYGGEFQNLAEASARLAIVVPLVLFLIFVLLYTTFKSARMAFLIFLNVPMAATGGILALTVRGLPFSISAGVGFIALFGIAVMNGVVLLSYIRQMRTEGLSPQEAAVQGAEVRLRAVLMTAVTDALGFLPMALATSAGAEVQRPLATVVIGGLITSFLLTMFVLPAIYGWFEPAAPEPELN
jgi:heavy metal efflux system protein